MSVRRSSAARTAASTVDPLGGEKRSVGRLEAHRPEARRPRIENEHAQEVLRAGDVRLGADHGFLVPRNLRLGLDDVDGRHRADRDPRSVVAQRLLGELKRLPLHVEERHGEEEVPVGVPHVALGRHDGLTQSDVGDLPVGGSHGDLLAAGVDGEVPQQGLRVREAQVGAQGGVERAEEAGGRAPRPVPARGIRAACPRHLLIHREDVAEALVDHLRVDPVEERRGRRRGVVPPHVERQVGKPDRTGVGDCHVLNLRAVLLGPDAEIVLERQRDGLVG